MNAVAKNIRNLRKRDGLTQDGLAEKLHVTRQAVSSRETGKTQPDIDTLSEIAEAFGTDITEVIYGEPRGPEQSPAEKKRKRVTAGVLGLVTLVMLLVALFLLPVLREQTGQAFHMRAYVLCRMLGLPLLYLFAAAFFMSVFSLFWDFRIKNTAVRRILLVPSAVFVLLYMGTVTLAWTVFVNRDVSWLFGAMFHVSDFYIAPAPAVFLLPGIGLYLGLKKRP